MKKSADRTLTANAAIRPVDRSAYGSAWTAPRLPVGFSNVFASFLVHANGIDQHAVVGGAGAPLVLLAGWPQNWYAWRELMLPLAEEFTVVAVDPRGTGLSEMAPSGYDSAALANDIVALMAELGYGRFDMLTHDIGSWTAYALAVDHPDKVDRLILGEMIIPGLSPSPQLLPADEREAGFLWHFNFNRVPATINEQLVRNREDIYFGHQFDTKAKTPQSVPVTAREFYIESLRRHPDALSRSFEFYRAVGACIQQNELRRVSKISNAVLAYAGTHACGAGVEAELHSVCSNIVDSVMIDCGHYVTDEAPAELLTAALAFFDNVPAVESGVPDVDR